MELKNKTILFLGSSVTYGSAAGGVSFVELMRDRCGIRCIKEAVSGTTLADINEGSYVSRLKTVDKSEKVDLFICQLSTNDATKKLPIREVRKSICWILDYVAATFGCPAVFYTGTYYESDEYAENIKKDEQQSSKPGKQLDITAPDSLADHNYKSESHCQSACPGPG